MVPSMTNATTIQRMSLLLGNVLSSVPHSPEIPMGSTQETSDSSCLGHVTTTSGLLLTCPLLSSWGTRAQPYVPARIAKGSNLL